MTRTGRVAPRLTQLALTSDPFPTVLRTSLKYDYHLSNLSPGIPTSAYFLLANSCYDPDYANVFGNAQPTYFQTLCGANGGNAPYNTYKVISWRIKFTIINRQSDTLTVIGSPAIANTAFMDTLTEANYFIGTRKLYLGQVGQSNDSGVLWLNGHYKDVYGTITDDASLVGVYNGNPGATCYQGIVLYGTGGTNINCSVAVELSQLVEFSNTQI